MTSLRDKAERSRRERGLYCEPDEDCICCSKAEKALDAIEAEHEVAMRNLQFAMFNERQEAAVARAADGDEARSRLDAAEKALREIQSRGYSTASEESRVIYRLADEALARLGGRE